jgi:GNAT superfamily N-acetyltransferase
MKSGEIEIRAADDKDRQAIAFIAKEIVESGRVFVFEDAADVVDYWYQPDAHIFVAVRGDEILGTYVVKPNQKGRGAHIANAGYMVRDAAMGLGIGTAMGKHSIALARRLGFEAMQFNMVVATNAGAVHLWPS